jgi:long-subunit fatty acid transport protein
MTFRLRLLLALVLAWAAMMAVSGMLHADETGAAFLKIDAGARAIGMGGAQTALAGDAAATYWNPAGLAGASREAMVSHAQWLEGLQHQHAAYVQPGVWGGALGVSATSLRSGAVEARGADRRAAGTFSAADTAVALSYAKHAGRAQVGATVKTIQQRIAAFQARGTAVDLGLKHPAPLKNVTLGYAVQNLGPKMSFEGGRPYHLPLTLKAGAGYAPSASLSMGYDLKYQPRERSFQMAYGVEFKPLDSVALRAGYLLGGAKTLGDAAGGSALAGLQGGFGLHFRRDYRLDYAVIPMGEAGNTQRLSFSAKF